MLTVPPVLSVDQDQLVRGGFKGGVVESGKEERSDRIILQELCPLG